LQSDFFQGETFQLHITFSRILARHGIRRSATQKSRIRSAVAVAIKTVATPMPWNASLVGLEIGFDGKRQILKYVL